MTRRIEELDVPLTVLQREIRRLVARQRAQGAELADRSAERLQVVLAPSPTKPEEGQ